MNAIAKIQFFFIITLVGVIFFSCDPNEKLPAETILEYHDHQIYRNEAGKILGLNLQIHFQDGDGNIGLSDYETTYNLYANLFDKQLDGTFAPMQIQDTMGVWHDIVFAYSVPVLSTDKSSVKGMFDISISEFEVEFMSIYSKRGVILFKIFMYDHDLIPSDTIETPEISIR